MGQGVGALEAAPVEFLAPEPALLGAGAPQARNPAAKRLPREASPSASTRSGLGFFFLLENKERLTLKCLLSKTSSDSGSIVLAQSNRGLVLLPLREGGGERDLDLSLLSYPASWSTPAS